MRIVVADDHPLLLDGVEALLATESGIDVVARCADGAEALQAVADHAPDVLVLDLHMPTLDGLDVLTQLGDDAPDVVLLAAELTGPEALEAVRRGVRGIVLKAEAPRRLIECLRTVETGERWIDPSTFDTLLDTALEREARTEAIRGRLTDRELDVVALVAEGLSNKRIADRLGIGVGTVKTHLYNIFQKLDVANRTELTVLAREHGLVS
jgi:DNA-binding NarL/FixJ family response regulator